MSPVVAGEIKISGPCLTSRLEGRLQALSLSTPRGRNGRPTAVGPDPARSGDGVYIKLFFIIVKNKKTFIYILIYFF
jgi:hypothetical protein